MQASAAKKNHMARLLVATLDSLCHPAVDLVQCLPLFPRTLSNLASVASPSVDAGRTTFVRRKARLAAHGKRQDNSYRTLRVQFTCLPITRNSVTFTCIIIVGARVYRVSVNAKFP